MTSQEMQQAPVSGSDLATVLETRRSTMPDMLVAPGPSEAELDRLLTIALRVPDHGRLAPWRIILIEGESKARWIEQLLTLAETREDAAKSRISTRKLASAPLIAAVISSPTPGHKVPEWEQELSAGALTMNLLNGAAVLGYGANWLTGWHAYDPRATELLNLAPGEKVAGVVLIGTIAERATERDRTTQDRVVSRLEI
ncbi:nitroreductase family protein [Croceicoccus naphthovorans]|uniref:Putative NAD(P)H nitroreductase n=1 Tax=Croceicoccus naphthovorans TaxID=1348774 RepID=A0A0G3XFQ0_9SPHN|nr:nitroreductase [Croceicoccus naphthovorans]AKM09466.1 hypothetical protein AB433_04890 [Croceicoccus naphthovorans]MBB3991529.1 nitroreductase [Croceicoccus naphthovorans]